MRNILVVLIAAGFVFGGFVFYSNRQTVNLPEIQASKESIPTPTPTPTIKSQTTTSVSDVHSADGTMILTMQKTINSSGISSYSFLVSSPNDKNVLVYSKNLTNGAISLPANSWSPDNKYFFIKESDAGIDNYLVFKADGANFTNGDLLIDVVPLYTAKVQNYDLRDITGWDAPGLLHVLTTGPSFWFDIGSRAFLQLATK